jgi:tetratricopeptide (TPR) repeat protein
MTNNIPKNIDWNLSLKKISLAIATAREQTGDKRQTIALIDKALDTVHDFVVTLYLEKALLFQHVYMTERDMLKKGNKKLMQRALVAMEEVVDQAFNYVEGEALKRWWSRVYRFYGRVFDYKEDYFTSMRYYKEAIKYAKFDPAFVKDGEPRWLEYEAFLAYAIMKSGDVAAGFTYSQKLYAKFKKDKYALALKKRDYTTWAIWITGISTRAVEALISSKGKVNKKEIEDWLSDSAKILNPPKSVKTWADFKYRKVEIATLQKMIGD